MLLVAAALALAPGASAPPPPATPARVIVCLAPRASTRPAAVAATVAPHGLRIVRPLGRTPPRDGSAVRPGAGTRPPWMLDPARVWLLEAPDAAAAARALESLRRDPRVEWAELDVPRAPQVWSLGMPRASPRGRARGASGVRRAPDDVPPNPPFPDDPLLVDGRQWGLDNLGASGPYGGAPGADVRARDAWRRTTGSNDVRLAIADTGIDPAHPDLAATMPDGTPRLIAALDVVAGVSVVDSFGHGTPVTGVAAALTNDGAHFDSLGVAGVCGGDGGVNRGCRIVPIKVTAGSAGGASAFALAAAVAYAADAGARAVNLSFAGDAPSRLERLAFLDALARGCVPVAAAGNHGFADGARPQYPAAFSADGLCVQVGASDAWDQRAAFSSYGPGLDLVAPGVDVWTTYLTYPSAAGGVHPGYVAASGTSFAAPFVTGAIGLLAAARPELDAGDLQPLLRASARDLGPPGPDAGTGCGRLDLAAALDSVADGMGIAHGVVAATGFADGTTDTLVVDDAGLGLPLRVVATLVHARAEVALPDSFVAATHAWVRVAGTTTARDGFRLPYWTPWATIVWLDARRFAIEGALYRTAAGTLPVPPDSARFAFTVIGPVRAGTLAADAGGDGGEVRAWPNPFTRAVRLASGGGATVEIFDVRGRRVRRARADDSVGAFAWDGCDDRGRALAPGLYLARVRRGARSRTVRLLKLE